MLFKEVVVNLKLNDDCSYKESKLLQIKKEYILFDIIKHYQDDSDSVIQETYLIFENNSIFRNAIRKFINDNQ
jgi:hypothetical protein